MLFLFASAQAFELDAPTAWSVPADAAALRFVARPEGLRLVVVGGSTAVLDATTGVTLLTSDAGATALLPRDADGDGAVELWTCGAAGLARAAWTEAALDAPVILSDTPCDALVEQNVVGTGVAVGGAALALWPDDGIGGLGSPTEPGVTFGSGDGLGSPLLAGADGAVLAASIGDETLTVVSALGLSTLAGGGPVAGVASGDDGWIWTLATGGLAYADTLVALAGAPGRVVVAEVDGDVLDDLVILYEAGSVGVVRGATGEQATFPVASGARDLALADLDADGCDDLAVLGPAGEVSVYRVVGCAGHVDADGDGAAPDAGDCDDTRADVAPGLAEVCDGLDNDCSGGVDDAPLAFALSVPEERIDEGTAVDVTLTATTGCIDTVDVAWSFNDTNDALMCLDHGATYECLAADDDRAVVRVTVTDDAGAEVFTDTVTLDVVNVSPTFQATRGGCGGSDLVDGATVRVGDGFTDTLVATDPGTRDRLSFSARNEPPGLTVARDGAVDWTVTEDDIGTWNIDLIVVDEDGGSDTVTGTVTVEEGGSGCCCGSGNAAIFLGFVFLAWSRRGSPPTEPAPPHPHTSSDTPAPPATA